MERVKKVRKKNRHLDSRTFLIQQIRNVSEEPKVGIEVRNSLLNDGNGQTMESPW